MTTVPIGEKGDITIPLELRRAIGIAECSLVVMEQVGDGILLRPLQEGMEFYTPERKAEFLLSNAIDSDDYAAAALMVREMGLDPEQIQHRRPAGV